MLRGRGVALPDEAVVRICDAARAKNEPSCEAGWAVRPNGDAQASQTGRARGRAGVGGERTAASL